MANCPRTVKNKIQTRHWDMSSQSSLESCPPNEECEDGLISSHISESTLESTPLPSKRARTMSIHANVGHDRSAKLSKKNFRINRPERLDIDTIVDSSTSPSCSVSPPQAPRHASESDISFFPSPRSVLERRTSTGSFF